MNQAQMIIRIDPVIKNKASRIARSEGKTISQVVRDLLDGYINDRDMEKHIDDLWDRTGRELRSRGISMKDVNRAIKEVRAETRRRR